MSYTGTPHTFTVGEIVTAATMNSIRDFMTGVTSNLDLTYTPVLGASTTAPTLGTGSTATGLYQQSGLHGLVTGHCDIKAGTSGTTAGSGIYTVSLPVTALVGGALNIGQGYFLDSSTATTYLLIARLISSTTFRLYFNGNSAGTLGAGSATIPGTLAVSDELHMWFEYEAA